MAEHALPGGNASGEVVRVGDTVRKAWEPSTAAVHELLRGLRADGIDVPEPLGRDAQGRQMLEYVEGTPAIDGPPLTDAELARVGTMIRAIHDVSAALGMGVEAETWEVLLPAERRDLICHNDLAPWNLIVGERWVFIDWDAAGPSTRVWDLAYAAQAFAGLIAGEPVDTAATRLRAFVDGYGADAALRRALPATMTRRTQAMYDHLAAASRTGCEPWARMFEEGHGAHWRAAAAYVAEHEDRWGRALA